MTYDKPKDQFVFNWKLNTQTGAETIKIEVSYLGTTAMATLSEAITIKKR